MIGAGERDRKVAFERYTSTVDGFGHETGKVWSTLCTAWAAVRFGTGQERREAAQEAGSLTATFHILRNNKTAALSIQDRIRFDGGEWDIASVVPSREYNAMMEVVATRKAV